jgi:hypothetical protein
MVIDRLHDQVSRQAYGQGQTPDDLPRPLQIVHVRPIGYRTSPKLIVKIDGSPSGRKGRQHERARQTRMQTGDPGHNQDLRLWPAADLDQVLDTDATGGDCGCTADADSDGSARMRSIASLCRTNPSSGR